MFIQKLIHPEYFQGNKKKNHYFEGWYYKLVSEDQKHTIAFIPGISLNPKDAHAFIQVFISSKEKLETKLKSYYFKFPKDAFHYGHDQFFVSIGSNYFSLDKLSIDLSNDQIKLYGTIQIDQLTPIKRNIFSPNIMGFFGYLGFMECYHGVISMSHALDGILLLNQVPISFHNAKGYIEKDWGKSFPRAYVWLQSNHFKDVTTSIMFSYADIPFLGFYFKGLIANLRYQGKEYRFATYNLSRVKKEVIKDHKVQYTLKKGFYVLEIEAESTTSISLASPRNGMMVEQIKEGLSGWIHVKLYRRQKLIFEDTGYHAGIEIMK
jgi:tocopherol cyclase